MTQQLNPVPAGASWRPDVIAGITAAAVVLPKAMAYATVAGLPVSVGLYTALVPMAIYTLLGTSRVLSVSSTTTLAILVATELALAVPDGDAGRLITATATLTALTGLLLIAASILRLGFVPNFISSPVLTGFKAGIGLVIVLDQVPKLLGLHITKDGFFRDLLSFAQHLPEASRHARDRAGGPDPALPHGAILAAFPRTARDRRGRHRRVMARGPRRRRRRDRGPHSPGAAIADAARSRPRRELLPGAIGIALMSFTETIAAGRAFALPSDPPIRPNRELLATGAANLAGGFFGAMPAGGGTSQTAVVRAVGGRTQKASLVTASASAATMLVLAPLLGLLPQAVLAAVVIVYSAGRSSGSSSRRSAGSAAWNSVGRWRHSSASSFSARCRASSLPSRSRFWVSRARPRTRGCA